LGGIFFIFGPKIERTYEKTIWWMGRRKKKT
jgi:hypothetical protein